MTDDSAGFKIRRNNSVVKLDISLSLPKLYFLKSILETVRDIILSLFGMSKTVLRNLLCCVRYRKEDLILPDEECIKSKSMSRIIKGRRRVKKVSSEERTKCSVDEHNHHGVNTATKEIRFSTGSPDTSIESSSTDSEERPRFDYYPKYHLPPTCNNDLALQTHADGDTGVEPEHTEEDPEGSGCEMNHPANFSHPNPDLHFFDPLLRHHTPQFKSHRTQLSPERGDSKCEHIWYTEIDIDMDSMFSYMEAVPPSVIIQRCSQYYSDYIQREPSVDERVLQLLLKRLHQYLVVNRTFPQTREHRSRDDITAMMKLQKFKDVLLGRIFLSRKNYGLVKTSFTEFREKMEAKMNKEIKRDYADYRKRKNEMFRMVKSAFLSVDLTPECLQLQGEDINLKNKMPAEHLCNVANEVTPPRKSQIPVKHSTKPKTPQAQEQKTGTQNNTRIRTPHGSERIKAAKNEDRGGNSPFSKKASDTNVTPSKARVTVDISRSGEKRTSSKLVSILKNKSTKSVTIINKPKSQLSSSESKTSAASNERLAPNKQPHTFEENNVSRQFTATVDVPSACQENCCSKISNVSDSSDICSKERTDKAEKQKALSENKTDDIRSPECKEPEKVIKAAVSTGTKGRRKRRSRRHSSRSGGKAINTVSHTNSYSDTTYGDAGVGTAVGSDIPEARDISMQVPCTPSRETLDGDAPAESAHTHTRPDDILVNYTKDSNQNTETAETVEQTPETCENASASEHIQPVTSADVETSESTNVEAVDTASEVDLTADMPENMQRRRFYHRLSADVKSHMPEVAPDDEHAREEPQTFIPDGATFDFSRLVVEPGHGDRPNKKKLSMEIREKVKTKGKPNKHLQKQNTAYNAYDYEQGPEQRESEECSPGNGGAGEPAADTYTDSCLVEDRLPMVATELPQTLDDREFNMVPEEILRKEDTKLKDIEDMYTVSSPSKKDKQRRRRDKKTKGASFAMGFLT